MDGIRVLVLFVILAFLAACLGPAQILAQQPEPPGQPKPASPEASSSEIVPGPLDIKESTAIFVFLGWAWLSILVLVYLLRLKIKELDRLYQVRFFSSNPK